MPARKTIRKAPAKTAVLPKSKCMKAAADVSGAGFRLADPMWNAHEILAALEMYTSFGVGAVVFPELCITGASCGDLFRQNILLDTAQKAVKFLQKETAALIDQMSHCALPYSCPHGRPTMLNISISEIERRFGRK